MNEDFRKRTGWTLYQSVTKDPTITDPTGANAVAVIAEFEALSYDNAWILNSFAVEHLFENENTNYAMNCDIAGAFLTTADRKFNVNSAIYSPSIEILAKLVDYFQETILWTPVVGETFDYVIGTTYTTHALPKSDSALYSAYSLTSLIEDNTAYALIENTDYTISTIDGVEYVTFISNVNYDLTTNKVVATYDYTPNVEDVMSWVNANVEVPYYAYKFVSCAYQAKVNGVQGTYQDTYYLTKTRLSWSVLDTYLNTGETFEASDVTLQWDIGWVLLKRQVKTA